MSDNECCADDTGGCCDDTGGCNDNYVCEDTTPCTTETTTFTEAFIADSGDSYNVEPFTLYDCDGGDDEYCIADTYQPVYSNLSTRNNDTTCLCCDDGCNLCVLYAAIGMVAFLVLFTYALWKSKRKISIIVCFIA